jgi:hypothetical protein
MSTIIPLGQQTVGNATVTLLSLLSSAEQLRVQQEMVHKVFLQTAVGNTNQIDVKYATKIVCTLYKPPATGPLPEFTFTADDNVGNNIDIANITLTGTNSSDKVNGYLAIT